MAWFVDDWCCACVFLAFVLLLVLISRVWTWHLRRHSHITFFSLLRVPNGRRPAVKIEKFLYLRLVCGRRMLSVFPLPQTICVDLQTSLRTVCDKLSLYGKQALGLTLVLTVWNKWRELSFQTTGPNQGLSLGTEMPGKEDGCFWAGNAFWTTDQLIL